MVKSRVSRNCVFERGRDGESGGTLKIRKIRFWAERGPALWGSTNRDRRGNKRCATTGPRRVNALGYDSSSGSLVRPPVEKPRLLASRISGTVWYVFAVNTLGRRFPRTSIRLFVPPAAQNYIGSEKLSGKFEFLSTRGKRFFSEETSKAKELDGFKLSERISGEEGEKKGRGWFCKGSVNSKRNRLRNSMKMGNIG